ncbi:unnamed protein product [Miscanthus lutarioriparius]|uniref:F-box domain-containing protein n=1 Tax=Miscanthus lutarioriparius TaxID=422564 RepID=A0A811SN04_9POAL|nr:unnamed protein product [Miscanthus lutarioriparius]
MSQGSEAARSKRKTADGSTDRLSGLPEGLLLDLLSFLPSRDAVRTCVLARRWRNLWKEVPALRITPATTSGYCGASALNRIMSLSLKRLMVAQCHFIGYARTQIYASNLILLLLVDCMGMTPLLVSMPYLVEAFIRLGYCNDFCKHSYEIGDCRDESCWGCQFYEDNYGKNNCILLHGLSSCTNLELTAATAPIHERLVEIGASYDLRKQSLVLKDLNVEVRCDDGNERVHKVFGCFGFLWFIP